MCTLLRQGASGKGANTRRCRCFLSLTAVPPARQTGPVKLGAERAGDGGANGHPACPTGGQPVDPLRARALAIVGGRIISFCSPACKERGAAPRVAEPIFDQPRRARPWRWMVVASSAVVLAGVLLGARVRFE